MTQNYCNCLKQDSRTQQIIVVKALSEHFLTSSRYRLHSTTAYTMSVKAGYRHLLRTCKQAFQADKAALNVAVQEIRTQVYSKADAHDPDQIREILLLCL